MHNRSFLVMNTDDVGEPTTISAEDEIEAVEQFCRLGDQQMKDGDEFLIIGIDEMHKITATVRLTLRKNEKKK